MKWHVRLIIASMLAIITAAEVSIAAVSLDETASIQPFEPLLHTCKAVRAAGIKTPLHRGDYGYNVHLDQDGDGVACE